MDSVNVICVRRDQQVQHSDTVARSPGNSVRQQVGSWRSLRQLETVSAIVIACADCIIIIKNTLDNKEFQHISAVALRIGYFNCTRKRDQPRRICRMIKTISLIIYSLAHGIPEYYVVPVMDHHLRIKSGTMLSKIVVQEYSHRDRISTRLRIVVGEMITIIISSAIAKIPNHAITLIVDNCIKGDVLIGTKLIILQLRTQHLVDKHLLAQHRRLGSYRIGIGFAIPCAIYMCHNSSITAQSVGAI